MAVAAVREFYVQRAAGGPPSGQAQPTGHGIGQPSDHQHVA
jgi:hypothetical protein